MNAPRRRRILVLVHEDLVPPDSLEGHSEKEINTWKTEYDVVTGLRQLGHDVQVQGVHSDLGVLRRRIARFRPHVTFNVLEEFHGVAVYDQHVVSYLELMRARYTGCNPRGLLLAHDKALSKKVMLFHRIPTPRFEVFPLGRRFRPSKLEYPLFVKSLVEDASMGISQKSVVTTPEQLEERVAYFHEQVGTDALAERYIDGRELYVGVLGNSRLTVFPTWEMRMTKLRDGAPLVATEKVKFDEKYQERIGLRYGPAEDLDEALRTRIARLARRVYKTLELTGYARIDLRLTPEGRLFVLEANPNPELALDGEFSAAANAAGLPYNQLLQRIVNLGLRYRAAWRLAEEMESG